MNKKNTRSWRRRVTKPSISCPRGQTYKTSLCDNWSLYGTCPYGDKCQYAHGVAERRVRPNTKNRVVMCKNFLETGRCPYGSKCSFIHTEASKFSSSLSKKIKRNKKYKTTTCKFWKKDGRCPYGDQCAFRHVDGPLRSKPVAIQNKEDEELLLVRDDNFERYMEKVATLSPISVCQLDKHIIDDPNDPDWLFLPH